jgi:hypothetical protein
VPVVCKMSPSSRARFTNGSPKVGHTSSLVQLPGMCLGRKWSKIASEFSFFGWLSGWSALPVLVLLYLAFDRASHAVRGPSREMHSPLPALTWSRRQVTTQRPPSRLQRNQKKLASLKQRKQQSRMPFNGTISGEAGHIVIQRITKYVPLVCFLTTVHSSIITPTA